jgi:hypothetical protein
MTWTGSISRAAPSTRMRCRWVGQGRGRQGCLARGWGLWGVQRPPARRARGPAAARGPCPQRHRGPAPPAPRPASRGCPPRPTPASRASATSGGRRGGRRAGAARGRDKVSAWRGGAGRLEGPRAAAGGRAPPRRPPPQAPPRPKAAWAHLVGYKLQPVGLGVDAQEVVALSSHEVEAPEHLWRQAEALEGREQPLDAPLELLRLALGVGGRERTRAGGRGEGVWVGRARPAARPRCRGAGTQLQHFRRRRAPLASPGSPPR